MAKIEVSNDMVREICMDFKYRPEQNSSCRLRFISQPADTFTITFDTGYTMLVINPDGTTAKTLTVGSGITLDVTDLNNQIMDFDFGNDLVGDYTLKMTPDNNIPPFDIIWEGTLHKDSGC